MTGKTLRNNLLLTLWMMSWFCTAGAWAAAPPIVVLLSDSESAYNRPVVTFSEEIQHPVLIFNLHGDITKDPQLRQKILSQQPQLIFALGAKAAYAAKLWTEHNQEIPVLFALVFNWQRYYLMDQDNMAGIAAEMAAGTQFINMTMVSPQIKKVGIVYGAHTITAVKEAQQAADLLGLELIDIAIDRSQDFRRAFKQIAPSVDAYWVVNDPLIYTLDNMDWLKDRCLKDKLVCLGQSINIAEAGLMMAVNPDVAGIGNQAASLANNIIKGSQTPAQIGVMPPLATQIILNRRTSRRIGLKLSTQSLNMATMVLH